MLRFESLSISYIKKQYVWNKKMYQAIWFPRKFSVPNIQIDINKDCQFVYNTLIRTLLR